MTQLEIALKLREQIKEQWPFVSTILVLYENNTGEQFTERIQDMVDRLLPKEVFYQIAQSYLNSSTNLYKAVLVGKELINHPDALFEYRIPYNQEIKSLPINQVLFASEDNPLGVLK